MALPQADRRCHQSLVSGLFLAAYGLRMLVVLPTHYVEKLADGSGALFLDDYTNDLVAEWLVRIQRGDGISIFPGHQHLLDSVYTYLLVGIYMALGYAPLVPKLLNIGLAAMSAVLVFELARKTFRMPVALFAGIGAAILPSMIVWSIATLKESLVLFLALFGLWTVQLVLDAQGRDDPRVANALVVLLGAVLLLLDLRSSTAAFLLVCLRSPSPRDRPIARDRGRSPWLALCSSWSSAALASTLAHARATARSPASPMTSSCRSAIGAPRKPPARARSSDPNIDSLSPTGSALPESEAASDAAPFTLVGDIFEPLGYALFAPTPWQARSTSEFAASAEMIVWYILTVTSLLAWRAAPRLPLFVTLLAGYAIANWLVLATAEGNIGNLLRHRLLLDPALLILGGAGALWLWERSGRPLAARVPRRLVVAHGEAP